ncbi:MAG: DNA polymerase III subunit delta [Saprospiraceae bacterium]|nr:DNA polymerase III subunit delta [Saprospiraceae bacterium]
MPELKYDVLLKQLKSKQYEAVYVFHGEEAFFIDTLTAEIEKNALPEAQQAFNQTILYGRDIGNNTGLILDAAMRLPMMAERQVIIVKEAQNIRDWSALEVYLERPNPSTLLVFAHKNKKLDGRSGFAKKLKKYGVSFYSKALRDYEVPKWVGGYLQANGFTIDPKAEQILVEFLGTELSKIANELDKLFLVLDKKHIAPADIEEHIGISKDYNVFELQNAIMHKQNDKVFRILNYFRQNPKAGNIVFIIGTIYSLFSKLYSMVNLGTSDQRELASAMGVNPYFLKDYQKAVQLYSSADIRRNIGLLAKYDLKSKGVESGSATDHDLLREMAFQIMA